MKKIVLFLTVALMPLLSMAQADKTMMDKAKAGDVSSMVALAGCYERGAGVPIDSAAALQWYQKAADKGSGEAAVRISVYYLTGSQVPCDTARYLAIRQELANKKDPAGLCAMAVTYLRGFGVSADTARALQLFNEAYKLGSPRAADELGTIYDDGLYGVKADSKKALAFFKEALKRGYIPACNSLASYYIDKEDYKNALKYINEGVRQSEPVCQCLEGDMYFMGRGVTMDERKGQLLMRQAALRYPSITFLSWRAGIAYAYTDDEELRNVDSAFFFWEQAANQGDARSRFEIASALMNQDRGQEAQGHLLMLLSADQKDNDLKGLACLRLSQLSYGESEAAQQTAIEWLRRGAEEYNNPDCWLTLARFYSDDNPDNIFANQYELAAQCYRKALSYPAATSLFQEAGDFFAGQGRYQEAIDIFQQMVDQGNDEGYYNIARCYSSMQRDDKALQYLKEGCKRNNANCLLSMGKLNEAGLISGKPEYKKAAGYYEKSGEAEADYYHALLYLNEKVGKGSDKDIAKGLALLESSRQKGYIDAYMALAYCYETGYAVGTPDMAKAAQLYTDLADADVAVGYFKLGQCYEAGSGVKADSVEALRCFRKAAEMGHGEAMCYLGDFHRVGQFLPLDKQKAFEYYRQADGVGEEIGTYYVGRSFLEGCGVPVDTAAAIPYLQRAANQGVGRAAYLLGYLYEYGKGGLQPDADSAIHYYITGYRSGDASASYKVGVQLFREGSYAQSAEIITDAARKGNTDAAFLLALFYQQGIGIEADPAGAYNLFQQLAFRTHDARAYTYMGLARLQGNGCKMDETLGKLYLDTAAALGNEKGMYYLAICYMQGYGCDPDSLLSVKWLQESARLGNAEAMNLMGDIYEEQEDFDNAVAYYQMAADADDDDGICNLGYCYEKGQGVILSYKKAFELYMKAAALGSARGYKMVANCYMEGIGVEKDVPEAIQCLMKAADKGDAQAMYLIASIYEDGDEGVKKDLKKAKEWYKKSAAAGFEPAAAALNRL